VVGWKPSREASRAVHDLVALAEPGAQIDLVMVDAEAGSAGHDKRAVEVERHLVRHGFKVTLHTSRRESWKTVAQMLEHFAVQRGADVLAVGGYAHSRAREVVLGGVTRDLIAQSRLPVLMAH
jgi:nucleotide-binding universal stress UspA family protein